MIAIFLHAGMRLGELAHLRWKDVFIYFRMENGGVRREAIEHAPENNGDLNRPFPESIARRFRDLGFSEPAPEGYFGKE